jgi:hypothetical protein
MKKIIALLLVMVSLQAFGQSVPFYITKWVRLYQNKLQYDSLRTGNWKNLATEGYAGSVGGSTYSNGYGLSLSTTVFSADTNSVATKAYRQKGIDSLLTLIGAGVGTLAQVTALGSTTPTSITLVPADPGTNTAVASTELWLTSKRDDAGSDDAVDWRHWQQTTNSFGSSEYYLQNRVNAGSWNTNLKLDDNGSVSFRGATVTGNYSLAQGSGSEARAGSGVIASQNADAFGDRSFIASGQNSVIDAGATGAVILGTDSHIYTDGDYSAVFNDANSNYGTAALIGGFGNYNYVENGFIMGSDNVLGATTSGGGTANTYFVGTILGLQNRSTASHTHVVGKYLYANATGAIVVGSGVSTANRLTVAETESFNVGFNSTVPSFIVHTASGAGTYGQVEAAGTLKIGTLANDDAEDKLVVWNSTDKVLEYRTASSLSPLSGSLVVSLVDGANIAVDASLGYSIRSTYTVTLGGNRTIDAPSSPTSGQMIVFRLKQDGTGGRTVTWDAIYRFSSDIPTPTLSAAAGYTDYVSFMYNAADVKWDVIGVNIGAN